MKQGYVYIMASASGVLYVGVTSDLVRRVYEHKSGIVPGFTKRYNVTRLAYYGDLPDMASAIAREKRIKAWRRQKKVALIGTANPKWVDMSPGWHDGGGQGRDSSLRSE